MNPVVFVILDGAADKGRKTPFSEARKPNLDFFASHGLCGLWIGPKAPKGYNPKSMSDVATLELLGYSYKNNPGRGFIEALGIGLKPKKDAIYIRGNFATVDKNLKIKDRRAGREVFGLDELAKGLEMKIRNIKIKCRHTLGHRCVVSLEGKGLSTNVTDSDKGENPMRIRPLSKSAEKTALILNEFSERANKILNSHEINKKRKIPANYILLRGAGKMKRVKPLRKKFKLNACSITGHVVIKGISRYLKIDNINVAGANADLNTNLAAKASAVLQALRRYNFVLLHINGCDKAGHDKNFRLKKQFIEKVDRVVFSKLKKIENINIIVTSDHRTPVSTGEHEFGSVPILFYSSKKNLSNRIKKFDEVSCSKGIKIENVMISALKLFEDCSP